MLIRNNLKYLIENQQLNLLLNLNKRKKKKNRKKLNNQNNLKKKVKKKLELLEKRKLSNKQNVRVFFNLFKEAAYIPEEVEPKEKKKFF